MNNHENKPNTPAISFSNNGSKNTIFMKKEISSKKTIIPVPKIQNNSVDQTKKSIQCISNMSSNITPDKHKIKQSENNIPLRKAHMISAKHYEIDSLSDSDDEQNDDDRYVDGENESYMVLSLQDIITSIPQNAISLPSDELQKTHTEWRWRFFDLLGRKLIEISKMPKNRNRVYMDNKGQWTEYTLKKEWDKYLVDTRYCYVQI